MRWTAVVLRRIADARVPSIALAGLVLVTAFLFALAPLLLDREAGVAFRQTFFAAPSSARNVTLVEQGWISPGSPDTLAVVRATGDQFENSFPAPIARLIEARYLVVDTGRFIPQKADVDGVTLRLRYLEGATDHVRLTAGRLPGTDTPTVNVAFPASARNDVPATTIDLPVVEIALSNSSAAALHVALNEVVALRGDTTDPLSRLPQPLAVRVVGLYNVPDGTDAYWFDDSSLEHPQVRSLSLLSQVDDATALIAQGTYPVLLDAMRRSYNSLGYSWRYMLDGNRLGGDSAAPLLEAIRRMESTFAPGARQGTGGGAGSAVSGTETGDVGLQSGLLRVVTEFASAWRSVLQVLSVVAVGCAAVALLALVVVSLLVAGRRAPSVALWRSRGASFGQVLAASATEVLPLIVAPALTGFLLAAATAARLGSSPGHDAVAQSAAGAAFVLIVGALAMVAGMIGVRAAVGGGAGGAAASDGRLGDARALLRDRNRRRLVLEAALIAAAIGGVYVLRQRGVSAASSAAGLPTADPLLAAVPVLAAIAAGLVVRRLLPVPLRLLGWAARRRRGLVAALALRRAASVASGPLLATLLATAAVSAFAALSIGYLDGASEASSWAAVGAPFRIASRQGPLPSDFDAAVLPGVEVFATATRLQAAAPDRPARVVLLAIDLGRYRDVTAGSGMPELPAAMFPETPPRSGEPIPAIVSPALAESVKGIAGSTFELASAGARNLFRIAAIEDSFPTLTSDTQFLVVSRPAFAATRSASVVTPTEVFIRAPATDAPELASAVAARLPGAATLTNRLDVLTVTRASPELQAVAAGLVSMTIVSAAYGVLALLAAAAIAGTARGRETAHLLVLGLARRNVVRLAAIERAPVALLVLVAGAVLGALLFAFLLPGLGLGAIANFDGELPLRVEPLAAVLIVAATMIVVGFAVALEALVASQVDPIAALRKGLE